MAAKDSVAIVSTYSSEGAALSDYSAVERFFTNDLSIDALNAAVVTRRSNGKVQVVRRRERSGLSPEETERLIGHMSRAGLKDVGLDNLLPGQTMLVVVATGDAWDMYSLEDQIVLTGDTRTIRASVNPATVFELTVVAADT
ncbi:MAG: hypothetical protein ACRDT2_07140 [Natronosporangium sp.]